MTAAARPGPGIWLFTGPPAAVRPIIGRPRRWSGRLAVGRGIRSLGLTLTTIALCCCSGRRPLLPADPWDPSTFDIVVATGGKERPTTDPRASVVWTALSAAEGLWRIRGPYAEREQVETLISTGRIEAWQPNERVVTALSSVVDTAGAPIPPPAKAARAPRSHRFDAGHPRPIVVMVDAPLSPTIEAFGCGTPARACPVLPAPTAEGRDAMLRCASAPASCAHGTAVASVILGWSPTGGVPAEGGLLILPLPVLVDGGRLSDIITALAALPGDPHWPQVTTINLSFELKSGRSRSPDGCADDHPVLARVFDVLRSHGDPAIVAASGNCERCADPESIAAPACLPGIRAVGAAGADGTPYRSRGGHNVDALEGGDALVVLLPDGRGSSFGSGTSLAAALHSRRIALRAARDRAPQNAAPSD